MANSPWPDSPWERRDSRDVRAQTGRSRREELPLEALAELGEFAADRNPLAVLAAQDADRDSDLVPIRYGRMSTDAFSFLRGSAAVMAADLAAAPKSGLDVQLCGDAHLSNFGIFAAPDRRLVFDLNDYDETLPGPFEWDVKRLAASIMVAARTNGLSKKKGRKAVRAAAREYRKGIARCAEMDPLHLFYDRFEMHQIVEMMKDDKAAAKRAKKLRRKAGRRNHLGAVAKLTRKVDGHRVIVSRPPLIVALSEAQRATAVDQITALYAHYLSTMEPDRRALLQRYALVDIARKVVGVGSVGTRCLIALFETGDGEPLVLQLKEARPSVLEPHVKPSAYDNPAERVVTGQRIIQSTPDMFLGWGRFSRAEGPPIDFYCRQLWDGKASARVEGMSSKALKHYARACGTALARAHARSGPPAMIAGYLGQDDTFDKAIARFAKAYADVVVADHAHLLASIESGDTPAIHDL